MSRDFDAPPALHERRLALVQVFKTLGARWPRIFAASRGDELMPVWLAAVAHCETAALVPAAVDFAATSTDKYAPDPAEFARHVRAYTRRATGQDRPSAAPSTTEPTSPLFGARAFWFDKPGPEKGPYRLNADRAVAFAIDTGPLAGGSIGITSDEIDRLWKREIGYGWLAPESVPDWAVPDGWHRAPSPIPYTA